jgi:hypothetical protein
MRMYRLCENEGRLDMRAYLALRDEITAGEALELEAALVVIADNREEYSEFRRDWDKRKRGETHDAPTLANPTGKRKVDPAEIRAEIAHREAALARDRARMNKHRMAVACAASGMPEPAGRMDLAAALATEQALVSHAQVIAYLTKQLESTANE